MYANSDMDHNADISLRSPPGARPARLQTRLGQFDEAVKAASDYKDIFGECRYFLELMDHGIEIERRVRDGLLEIGRKLNIPPLVTNDSHYTYANEATAHDALLCIQTGKNLSDPDKYEVDVITKLGARCTSSSSPTSSCGPRTTASRLASAAVPAQDR